jgi:asparagine synthetase B (glutamine-hydrolysing)
MLGPASETTNARLTAQALGNEHHELVPTRDELLGRVPALLSGMDQPLAAPCVSCYTPSRSTPVVT